MKIFILLVALASAFSGTQAETLYISYADVDKNVSMPGIAQYDSVTDNSYKRREDNIKTEAWSYFFIMNKNNDRIYSIEDNEDGASNLVVYVKDLESGKFTTAFTSDTEEDLYYLTLDDSNEHLLTADFFYGYVELLKLSLDGNYEEADYFNVSTTVGDDGKPVDGEISYPYQVEFVPKQLNMVGVTYAGLDKVIFFEIDTTNHKIKPTGISAATAKGSFPVKFTFSADGNFMYVLCLFSANVIVFEVKKNQDTGKIDNFVNVQEIPSLLNGTSGGVRNWDLSIEIGGDARLQFHPSGKFLYAMHCAKQQIAAYKVDETGGKLTTVSIQPIQGDLSFGMVVTKEKVIVSNENTGTVNVYSVNQETGELTELSDSRINSLVGAGYILYRES